MRRSVWLGLWAFVVLMAWLAGKACYGAPLRESAVRIVNGPYKGSGTVLFHQQGCTFVLTAWHVVRDGLHRYPVIAYCSDGIRYPASVHTSPDKFHDLVLLAIHRAQVPATGWRSEVRVNERVTSAGFGAGPYRESAGVYQRSYVGNAQYSCQVRQGDSGGGIFNAQNQLVGVVSAGDSNAFYANVITATPGAVHKYVTGATIDQAYFKQYVVMQGRCPSGQCGRPYYGAPMMPTQQVRPSRPPSGLVPGSIAAPKPKPKPQPPTPATDPCEDLRDQLAVIAAQMKTNQELLAKIESTPGRNGKDGEQGPPGPAGKQGRPGLPGKDGKDAAAPDVDLIIARIREDIKADVTSAVAAAVANIDVQAPQTDVDELAALVLKRLPPFTIRQQDPYTGELGEPKTVRLGDAVTLKAAITLDE